MTPRRWALAVLAGAGLRPGGLQQLARSRAELDVDHDHGVGHHDLVDDDVDDGRPGVSTTTTPRRRAAASRAPSGQAQGAAGHYHRHRRP